MEPVPDEENLGQVEYESDFEESCEDQEGPDREDPEKPNAQDVADQESLDQKSLEEHRVEETSAKQDSPDRRDLEESNVEETSAVQEGLNQRSLEEHRVEETSANQDTPDGNDLEEPQVEERFEDQESPDQNSLEETLDQKDYKSDFEESCEDQEGPDREDPEKPNAQDVADQEGLDQKSLEEHRVEATSAKQDRPDRKDLEESNVEETSAVQESLNQKSLEEHRVGETSSNQDSPDGNDLEEPQVEERFEDQESPDQNSLDGHRVEEGLEQGSLEEHGFKGPSTSQESPDRQDLEEPNVKGIPHQESLDQRSLEEHGAEETSANQDNPDGHDLEEPQVEERFEDQDFAWQESERKDPEDPSVQEGLADRGVPDRRKPEEHPFQDYLFDEDGLSDTMEVIDNDALFAERVSELLLPSMHSILKGPRSDGAAHAGGLRKVDESPLAHELAAAAGDPAREETSEALDSYPLTVEQILQTSSEPPKDAADGDAMHEADGAVVVEGQASTDDPHLGLPALEQTTLEGQAAEGSTVPLAAVDQENLDQKDYEFDFEESTNDQDSPTNQESPDQKDMGAHPVEESPADQENLDQKNLEEANADQTSTNLEGLDQNEVDETNVEQTSTNLEGLDQNGVEETNVEQTSTNLEGLDQNELEETNVEQTSIDQTAEDQLLDDRPGAESPEGASPTAESAAVDLIEDHSVTDGLCMHPCPEDVDGEGQPITDHLTLESIGVAEPADPASLDDLRTGQAMQETLLIEQPFLDPMPLAATEHIIDVTSDGDPCGFTGDQASHREDPELSNMEGSLVDIACGSDAAASPAHESVTMSSADEAPRRVEAWSEDPGHPSHARGGAPVRRASGSSSPTDQLPALVGPDGQPLRSSDKVQGQASNPRRPSTDQRKDWGTSWSPGFPTDRQLARKVDSMLRDHEETRFRSQNRTAAGKPGKSGNEKSHAVSARKPEAGAADSPAGGATRRAQASAGDSPASGSTRRAQASAGDSPASGATRRAQASAGDSPASGATRRAQAASGRVSTRPRHGSTAGTMLPSLGASSSSPGLAQSEGRPPKKKKCEPAKIRHEDGRFTLRGVRSTSDLERYAKGVDLQSRKGIEVRAAFKTMRSSQHSAVVQETWSALYSLQASERSFDDWYTSAKDGARYRFRL